MALVRDHAAVVAGNRLMIVDTRTAAATALELDDVVDIAPVGSEVWAVAGPTPALHRCDVATARFVGEPIALPGDRDGAASAVWTGGPTVIAADRSLARVPGEWSAVFPVSATRWLVASGDRVALRDPTTERWSTSYGGARIVDGAVLFDGRSAALVTAYAGALAQLLVIGLHDGALQHRVTLTAVTQVRFAPSRGYAMLVSGARTLVLFDLRFGRVIKEHVETRDVAEVALDPTGQTFVVRYGADLGDVVFGYVRDLVAEPDPERADAPTAPSLPALSAAPALCEPASAPTAIEFHRGHLPLGDLDALVPRDAAPSIAPSRALAIVDRYGELVASLVGRAIAVAWDTGRIAFPNENMLPFRGEVSGILGLSGGRASDEIAAAERRVLDATAAVRETEGGVSADAPMAMLARELGLSPVARLLLLLVAGPTLWGELARLYGILGNDEDRPLVDELMLVHILAGQIGRHDIARELDRSAPLVRFGLVHVDDTRQRPFAGLSCDPIVLAMLRADASIDAADLRPRSATCTFDDLWVAAATKDLIVRALATAGAPARIVIRGRAGSGRHTTLAALAERAGRQLAVIDASSIVLDLHDQLGRLRLALCRAHLLGMLPCIDGLEGLAGDDRIGRAQLAALVDAHPGPVAVRLPWDARPPLDPGYIAIDLPALTLVQRTACWRAQLAAHAVYVRDPDELADRYGIGPGTIDRVCARVAASPSAPDVDRGVELEAAVRQHLETGLRATATRVDRLASWSRVVLPADIQDSVLELIARIKHRRTVYDAWGYDQVLTTSRGVTALFQGAPGTGKTLVASAIANELGMDLYRVDLSRVMSKWIGETEQNLAKLFDAAEDGHAIILFDEADSLFAKRTEVRTSVDRYANLEVNYLLQRLDSFEGIAILTTNFGTSIDGAFKRRLSFRLTFPFPDEDAREQLWRAHLAPSVPKAGVFDFPELARKYRLSGGYIRNAAVRAAFLAAEEQAALTQQHLVRAIQAEFREIGKIGESGVLE